MAKLKATAEHKPDCEVTAARKALVRIGCRGRVTATPRKVLAQAQLRPLIHPELDPRLDFKTAAEEQHDEGWLRLIPRGAGQGHPRADDRSR